MPKLQWPYSARCWALSLQGMPLGTTLAIWTSLSDQVKMVKLVGRGRFGKAQPKNVVVIGWWLDGDWQPIISHQWPSVPWYPWYPWWSWQKISIFDDFADLLGSKQRDQILGIHIWVLKRLHVHFFVALAGFNIGRESIGKKWQLQLHISFTSFMVASWTDGIPIISHLASSHKVSLTFEKIGSFPGFPRLSQAFFCTRKEPVGNWHFELAMKWLPAHSGPVESTMVDRRRRRATDGDQWPLEKDKVSRSSMWDGFFCLGKRAALIAQNWDSCWFTIRLENDLLNATIHHHRTDNKW